MTPVGFVSRSEAYFEQVSPAAIKVIRDLGGKVEKGMWNGDYPSVHVLMPPGTRFDRECEWWILPNGARIMFPKGRSAFPLYHVGTDSDFKAPDSTGRSLHWVDCNHLNEEDLQSWPRTYVFSYRAYGKVFTFANSMIAFDAHSEQEARQMFGEFRGHDELLGITLAEKLSYKWAFNTISRIARRVLSEHSDLATNNEVSLFSAWQPAKEGIYYMFPNGITFWADPDGNLYCPSQLGIECHLASCSFCYAL